VCSHGSPVMVVSLYHVDIPISSARDRRGMSGVLTTPAGGTNREDKADDTREECSRLDLERVLT
jgi:hypothetical protein